MSLRFAPAQTASEPPPWISCAFVNNMPDSAFDATERQFCDLLDHGSGSKIVEVRRFALPEVPRGIDVAQRIRDEYRPIDELYQHRPDVLIVTGSNPVEVDIRDEPYWDSLTGLLMWARDTVPSTLLSCLSAHAALQVFDGIERVRLPAKCTGVFAQTVATEHDLTRGLAQDILLPHSRWNSAPLDALEQAGYDVLVHSNDTGWGVATRMEGPRRLVLVQGHPEYDPWSLLREYRRDAGRYVRRERDDVPCLPLNCTADDEWESLLHLHEQISRGQRDPELVDDFPFDDVASRAPWSWRDPALRFYANWLTSVGAGKG